MGKVDYKQNALGADIHAINTVKGWMLRVKRGTQNLYSYLHDNKLLADGVFIPKVWVGTITPPATQTDDVGSHIYLPSFINQGNFLGVTARLQFINLTNGESCIWKWSDSGSGSPEVNHVPNVEMTLRYYPAFNRITLVGLDVSSGIYTASGTSGIIHDSDDDNLAKIIVTVFFK